MLLVGRHLDREDDDVVASSADGSVMIVEVALTMEFPEVEEEEALVLSMVDDYIIQWLIIIGEIRSGGLYAST